MLSEDSDSDTELQLTINEHYAKAYAYKKEREELGKLKEKYGSDAGEDEEEEDSEDLETEDEDGEELTPGVDAAILRLLAKIKRKDPAIYEEDRPVFDEEKQKSGNLTLSSRTPKDSSKPVTLRQQKLAAELDTSRSPSPEPRTHIQEQRELRDETIAVFHTAVDDEDDFLVPREKSKDEIVREEEEYQEFLRREVGEDLKGLIGFDKDEFGIRDGATRQHELSDEKKKKKKKTKGREKVPDQDDQEFLMNYILNRGWIDREAQRLPTYAEVTTLKNSKDKEPDTQEPAEASGSNLSEVDLDAEEEFDDVAEVFESSYNFRYEEPEAATISRHPRNLASTVRREDTTRKDARERKKARKEEAILKKKEEVKRLKALKMKELKSKLEMIGREGGWDDIAQNEAFQELDLDGDWDPEAHDAQMANIYHVDDDAADDEKPSWDDDIELGDIIAAQSDDGQKSMKKKKKKKKNEDMNEKDGMDVDAMDADNIQPAVSGDEEEWDGTEEMRKRILDKYMEELYGMEFNDMVGGMPTRFKYTTTAPQTFGLTPAEILTADDKDLNQYMGIKKYAPYRKGNWDGQRPDRLKEFKQKLSEKKGRVVEETEEKPVKKRKGRKERQKLKGVTATDDSPATELQLEAATPALVEKKRKREEDIQNLESTADQETSKKRKRRHKKPGLKESS